MLPAWAARDGGRRPSRDGGRRGESVIIFVTAPEQGDDGWGRRFFLLRYVLFVARVMNRQSLDSNHINIDLKSYLS